MWGCLCSLWGWFLCETPRGGSRGGGVCACVCGCTPGSPPLPGVSRGSPGPLTSPANPPRLQGGSFTSWYCRGMVGVGGDLHLIPNLLPWAGTAPTRAAPSKLALTPVKNPQTREDEVLMPNPSCLALWDSRTRPTSPNPEGILSPGQWGCPRAQPGFGEGTGSAPSARAHQQGPRPCFGGMESPLSPAERSRPARPAADLLGNYLEVMKVNA